MQNLAIDLSKVALILWSGMLIISGSIWILSSQVRRLGDLMEQRLRTTAAGAGPMAAARAYSSIHSTTAITLREAAPASRCSTRTVAAGIGDTD